MTRIPTGYYDDCGTQIHAGDTVDLYGEMLLIDYWRDHFVAVYPPTCRAEEEGECKHDNLIDMHIECTVVPPSGGN